LRGEDELILLEKAKVYFERHKETGEYRSYELRWNDSRNYLPDDWTQFTVEEIELEDD